MKLGAYDVTAEGLHELGLLVANSLRVRLGGIPAMPGETAADIAREVLRRNARPDGTLWAGHGHFRFMWISDFGKALRGALTVLDAAWLGRAIAHMVRASARAGRVTSVFTARRGVDLPYWRGDNLPWLIWSVAEHARATGDRGLAEEARPALARLLADYERRHFRDGLISTDVTGDWMDTILRPSSTYNNVCALMMAARAPEIGLEPTVRADALEARILERRWRGDRFMEYEGAETPGVDAGVYALYFGLFPADVREALFRFYEGSDLLHPLPMRVASVRHETALMPPMTRFSPGYHSCTWLHVGLMYLNAKQRAGRDVSAARAEVERAILRHRNVLETYDANGEPYMSLAHATEWGFTMASGQYLELVAGA